MAVMNVTDANFDQEVLKSDLPVLVDFSAAWCGPCKQIEPFVNQLSDEFAGRVKFVKVDIDEAQGIAAKLGIRGVPTLKMFKGGQVVAEQVGAAPKAKLAELVQRGL